MLFQLFTRGWRESFDVAVNKLNLRCSLPLLNDQPDDEGPDDDFAATTSKRLRRGSQFFAKPDSIPTLAFAVLSMTPYQRLMGFLVYTIKSPLHRRP